MIYFNLIFLLIAFAFYLGLAHTDYIPALFRVSPKLASWLHFLYGKISPAGRTLMDFRILDSLLRKYNPSNKRDKYLTTEASRKKYLAKLWFEDLFQKDRDMVHLILTKNPIIFSELPRDLKTALAEDDIKAMLDDYRSIESSADVKHFLKRHKLKRSELDEMLKKLKQN